MSTLESLTPNASVRGILPDALVSVVNVQWYGSDAVELTYKTAAGKVANELLYRHDESRIEVVEKGRPWSFDGEGALFRMVRSAYHLLGMRTYLTTGEKETRAWTFYAGSSAPECAGRIHTDFQRGFIKAEVIHWDELLEIGSWNKAKELGKIRIEGKDYHPLDGDVMEFRFNV